MILPKLMKFVINWLELISFLKIVMMAQFGGVVKCCTILLDRFSIKGTRQALLNYHIKARAKREVTNE